MCYNFRSHNNVELLKVARDNDIILGELPSHTSHWTQPFDRCVFKSLKSSWNTNVDTFIKETGVTLTHVNFFKTFSKALKASITKDNIVSGFRATGIFPFNPDSIPENAYKPAGTKSKSSTPILPDAVTVEQHVHVPNSPDTGTVVPSVTSGGAFDPLLGSTYIGDTENTSDNDLHLNDSVSSVMLSIPLSTSNILELPVSLDPFGNLLCDKENIENETAQCTEVSEVSDDTAVGVIESAMTNEQLTKFCAALMSGVDLDDKLFHTWKIYKQKSSNKELVSPAKVANDMFPLPQSQNARKRKSISTNKGFFAITADDVFHEKLFKFEEKKRKDMEKEKRKNDREHKKVQKKKSCSEKKKTQKS